MYDTCKQWEGQIVNGQFPLIRFLDGSEHSEVFLTERYEGQHLVKAVIKLVPAAPGNGELQLSRWQQSAELSHPHLIPLYEMGRWEFDGVSLLYIVMGCAEENVAQVLPDRPLTSAEARAMLGSVLDVLAYLHRKGFVHGQIRPANIMASDDQLKVSSDGLCRTGEAPLDGARYQTTYDPPEIARNVISVPQTMSPAGDVWSLGMTLVETLTQALPALRTAEQQDPLIPQSLEEPFLEIARHCLVRHPQGRWTVAQIATRLEGRAPTSQVPSISPRVPTPLPAPQRIAQPSRPLAKHRSYSVPIAVGFVLLLVAILGVPRLLRRHIDSPQSPAAAETQLLVPPATKEVAPSPPELATKTSKPSLVEPSFVEEDRKSKAPVPVPVLVHPDTIQEGGSNMTARLPSGVPVGGEAVYQMTPEVPQSARDSIRGTVRVSVKVNVDRLGNVEDAELESPGPSKYFARTALGAAHLWKFKPPKVGGQGVLSSWTLQFEFTRDETTVVAKQEMP